MKTKYFFSFIAIYILASLQLSNASLNESDEQSLETKFKPYHEGQKEDLTEYFFKTFQQGQSFEFNSEEPLPGFVSGDFFEKVESLRNQKHRESLPKVRSLKSLLVYIFKQIEGPEKEEMSERNQEVLDVYLCQFVETLYRGQDTPGNLSYIEEACQDNKAFPGFKSWEPSENLKELVLEHRSDIIVSSCRVAGF